MDEIRREAERRYDFDALFHARVHRAVETIEAHLGSTTGRLLNREDRSLATLAAAVGLQMADVDPAPMHDPVLSVAVSRREAQLRGNAEQGDDQP